MPPLEISIPTTSTVSTPTTHTVYHLTLRLPLRTFTLTKRYSDFDALHSQLTSEAGSAAPPAPLPPKTYLAKTLKNPLALLSSAGPTDAAQIEERRCGLEAYLRAINDAPDPRWRNCPAWRNFLNLPASIAGSTRSGEGTGGGAGGASTASALHAAATAPKEPIADPVAWLDAHRELKSMLRAARAAIASRDSGGGGGGGGGGGDNSNGSPLVSSFTGSLDSGGGITSPTPAAAHEAAATAKKYLVRAAGLLAPLEQGLAQHGSEWSRNRLGEGEVRRRKDLLAAARHELSSLEGLLALVRRKGDVDGVVEGLRAGAAAGSGSSGSGAGREGAPSASDTQALLGAGGKTRAGGGGGGGGVGKGRVLGRETARTRELDNAGVLQLQQTLMAEQDADLDSLTQVVRRQRELGEQINAELREQSELLDLLDEDVDRVSGKIKVARKRADKIS